MPSRLRKRKTLRRFHVHGAIYFVTATTRRRRAIFVDAAADAVVQAFSRLRDEQRAAVLAYVVMPDHLHALVEPGGDAEIGAVMKYLKRIAGNQVRRLGHAGRLWEARFYDRVMRNEVELASAVHYIHENPVRAGLCARPEDWRWGTASPAVESDLQSIQASWEAVGSYKSQWTPEATHQAPPIPPRR